MDQPQLLDPLPALRADRLPTLAGKDSRVAGDVFEKRLQGKVGRT